MPRTTSIPLYFALTEQEHSRLSYVVKLDIEDDEGANLPAGMPLRPMFTGLAAGD